MRLVGHVTCVVQVRNVHNILVYETFRIEKNWVINGGVILNRIEEKPLSYTTTTTTNATHIVVVVVIIVVVVVVVVVQVWTS